VRQTNSVGSGLIFQRDCQIVRGAWKKNKEGGGTDEYTCMLLVVTVGFFLCLLVSFLSDESRQKRTSRRRNLRRLNANEMKGLPREKRRGPCLRTCPWCDTCARLRAGCYMQHFLTFFDGPN
jgi:hypothetical protein